MGLKPDKLIKGVYFITKNVILDILRGASVFSTVSLGYMAALSFQKSIYGYLEMAVIILELKETSTKSFIWNDFQHICHCNVMISVILTERYKKLDVNRYIVHMENKLRIKCAKNNNSGWIHKEHIKWLYNNHFLHLNINIQYTFYGQ